MARTDFEKWQAIGNHHVVVERQQLPRPLDAALVQALCNPCFGIGADGVLEVSWENGTPRMTVWNADGSVAENCGNGIRIVARYLSDQRTLPDDGVILTGTQTTTAYVRDDGRVTVHMGRAHLPSDGQPETLEVDGVQVTFVEVSMGNSHAVIEGSTLDMLEHTMRRLGPHIEVDPRFPDRTNVEFVVRDDAHRVHVQVWERGVGPTLACGTGACAVAAAMVRRGHARSPVSIVLPGGGLDIGITHDLEVTMTGDARRIYRGEVDLDEIGVV